MVMRILYKAGVIGPVSNAMLLVVVVSGFFFLSAQISNVSAQVPVQPEVDVPSDDPPPASDPPPVTEGDDFSNPLNIDPAAFSVYSSYLDLFVKKTGAAISNFEPVPWCPNSCIGCAGDVTSEAVGRSLVVSATFKDKPIVDRYTDYYHTVMKFPSTGHMMWKLNENGEAGSCGGQNSAVDGELEAIEGLVEARKHWSADSEGRSYLSTQMEIQNSLKSAVIETPVGKTLPFCAYPSGGKIFPCEKTVYVGYLNLKSLAEMCSQDASWCEVLQGSREVVKGALDAGSMTVHTSQDAGTGQYGFREHFVHNLWVLEHALEDSDQSVRNEAMPFYDESRRQYYENGQRLCQEFKNGCKATHPPMFVYAEYLEMAKEVGDVQFQEDLEEEIFERCPGAVDVCGLDNYKRVVVLQALSKGG